ncbi:MAG: hypothetical protein KDD75_22195, partial [Caldilineaceae bacterium]|nr:hypothetical protein [Caldilineaceae bacterium]
MWATVYPLAGAAGVPPLEIGPWLTVAAAALWALSRAAATPSVAERRALATTIFRRQFVRCSAVLSLVAIAHALAAAAMLGWHAALSSLVVTCAGGAVTLLLGAGILESLDAARRARLLVYLACLAGTGAVVAAAAQHWGVAAIDAALAAAGLALAGGGLGLLNRAASAARHSTTRADRLRAFGSPMAHLAPGIAAAAVVASLVETAAISRTAAAVDPRSCIVPLLAGALVCLTTVRAARNALWLHGSLLAAGAAALAAVVAAAPQADGATWLVGALLVLHGVLAAAWLVRWRAASLGRALGIDAAQCELPLVAWPAVGGAIALAVIASCWIAAAVAKPLFSATLSAPAGMLASVLAMGLFAHGSIVRPTKFWAHGAVPAATLALLWSTFAASWGVFPPDLALTLAAIGWATVGTWFAQRASRAAVVDRSGPFDCWSLPVMSWAIVLGAAAAAVALPLAWNLTSAVPHVLLTWALLAVAAALAGYVWAAAASQGPAASSGVIRACIVAEWTAGVLGIAAMGALSVWLHRAGPPGAPFDPADALPTLALSGAALGLGYLGAAVCLRRGAVAEALTFQDGERPAHDLAVEFRHGAGRALDGLAAAALALASVCLVLSFGVPASATALLAFPLAAAGWVAVGWRLQRGATVYAACAVLVGGVEYLRTGWWGLEDFASFERAFACLGASLLLYGA